MVDTRGQVLACVAGWLVGGRLGRMKALVDLFLPVECGGCGAGGVVLCVRCAGAFDGPFDVQRPAVAHGPPVHALADYRDSARAVVLSFKERGRRDLALPLGRMMAAVLPTLDVRPARDGMWWLVPAPSRAVAARRRGGSHMVVLARCMAAAMSARGHRVAVAPALRLARGVRDSAGLSAAARIANLTGRIRVCPAGAPPAGAAVVVLDDVVTTGATAAACTEALQAAGLEVVVVLSLTAT
jgi:predicted amidophosphoribosyltransferase